jgi:hypothetical protein
LAAKDGNALVNVGMNLVFNGQGAKGLQLMQQGVAKGGLKRPEDAKLHLAIAYLLAGDNAKAQATFKTVSGNDGTADLARLWALTRAARGDFALPRGRAGPLKRPLSPRALQRGDVHRGARRMAPSSRITSPFSISFVTIWWTSLA